MHRTPIAFESLLDRLPRDACDARPFLIGMSLPVVRHQHVSSGVSRLFCPCGPSAVASFVWAIVVNSVQRVLGRRTQAHVSKERAERCVPLLADSDPACSIETICCRAGIVAPLLHPSPNVMFWRLAHAVSASVSALASTTLAVSINQFSSIDGSCCATDAPAKPPSCLPREFFKKRPVSVFHNWMIPRIYIKADA